jgi:hypothetical protein
MSGLAPHGGQLYVSDEPHAKRRMWPSPLASYRELFGVERCLEFIAFFFGLRSRGEKLRQPDKSLVPVFVNNPSAPSGHDQSL